MSVGRCQRRRSATAER